MLYAHDQTMAPIRVSEEVLEAWWLNTRQLSDHGYSLEELIANMLEFLYDQEIVSSELSYHHFIESVPGFNCQSIIYAILPKNEISIMATALETLYYNLRNVLLGYYSHLGEMYIKHRRFDMVVSKNQLYLMR